MLFKSGLFIPNAHSILRKLHASCLVTFCSFLAMGEIGENQLPEFRLSLLPFPRCCRCLFYPVIEVLAVYRLHAAGSLDSRHHQ